MEQDKNITISKKLIESHFRLHYAQTCYSLQGMDIDEPFTIFDMNNMFVDMTWIYTAISRATKIEYMHIFLGETDDLKLFDIVP